MLLLMREAFKLQRMFDNRKLFDEGRWPTKRHRTRPRMALEWATIENARALRMDHKIGTIKPGKQADIILVRTDDISVAPAEDPIHIVVLYAETADIDTVFVAGKKQKEGGRLTFDARVLAEKKENLAQSRRRIMEKGKFAYSE
jgi:cytosine/adenosine deaminase-related metal-dependent hydrolase